MKDSMVRTEVLELGIDIFFNIVRPKHFDFLGILIFH